MVALALLVLLQPGRAGAFYALLFAVCAWIWARALPWRFAVLDEGITFIEQGTKLATVSARVGGVQLADTTSACRTIAMAPAKTAAARIAVRMRVNMRPIVAQ